MMMRGSGIAVLVLAVAAAVSADHGVEGNALSVSFFGSRTCEMCLTIKQDLLKPLQARYPAELRISYHDIEDPDGLHLLTAMEEEYKVPVSSSQSLFLPDTFLTGYADIMKYGRAMIEARIGGGLRQRAVAIDASDSAAAQSLRRRAANMTLLGIAFFGLLDGINPCAIATMIFLISFLATQKRSRRQVLAIGLSFTAAVFVTYFLMGFGAFEAITALKSYRIVSEVIRWIAVAFAVVVAGISFWDAFRYKQTGDAKEVKLQLPKPLKLRIHKIITGNLSGSQLVVGAVTAGFLVTLLEAVCTGQMYGPTIIAMTRLDATRWAGVRYLGLYNFFFVLPLLIVMVLAYYGLKWNTLAKMTQSRLPLLKVLLGTALLLLAVYLVWGEALIGALRRMLS